MPSHSIRSGASPGDGLFVGRDVALRQSAGWLSEVSGGHPRLILCSGEPGIGKSRLLKAITERFLADRGTVVTTSCSDRTVVPRNPISEIETGLGGSSWATLSPTSSAAATGLGAADAVTNQLDAVLQLIAEQTNTQPLLLAIDDVHWADKHTRTVLEALVATLFDLSEAETVPVGVVLTARAQLDGEVYEWWHRLTRSRAARELPLEGFGPLETTELFVSVFDRPPEVSLLAAIERATQGNPLHLLSLFARLRRERLVTESAGRWELTGTDLLPTAEPLETELAVSLNSLEPVERDVLERLSVFGDSAHPRLLERSLAEEPDRAEASAFEDSTSALVARGFLRMDGNNLSFAHPLVRKEVYRGLGTQRRRELHASSAEALGCVPHDLSDQDLISVAHHLHLAGDLADRQLLAGVIGPAADAAAQRGAWADASRFWRMALEVTGPEDVATTHLLAGIAAYNDLDATSCRQQLRLAIQHSRRQGDLGVWGQALEQLLRNDLVLEPESISRGSDNREAREFLEAAGDDHPEITARIYDVLANIAFAEQRSDVGEELALRGLEIVKQLYGSPTEGLLRFTLGLHSLGRLDLSGAEYNYRRSHETLEQAPERFLRGWVPGRLALLEILRGRARESERHAIEATRINRSALSWAELSLVVALRAGTAAFRGNFAEAEQLGREADNAYQRSNFYVTPAVVYPAVAAARALRGNAAGAHAALDEMERSGARGAWRYRLVVDWLCGDRAGVRRTLLHRSPNPPGQISMLGLGGLAMHAELAVLLRDVEMAQATRHLLEEVFAKSVRATPGWPSSVGRLIASIAVLEGDLRGAEAWLDEADRTADRLDSPVERSLVSMERARLTVAHGDGAAAAALLERCVVDFDQLGMLPHRSQAIELLAETHDSTSTSRPSGVQRFILFTDLCSSTQLNRSIGDEQYLEVVAKHNRVVRRRLGEFDGVEVKQTGDGILAWFSDADRAIRCAVAAVTDMERLNVMHPERPVHVRAGLSVGAPLPMDGDLYGLSVAEAARICDAADPGCLLAGEEVVAIAVDPPAYRHVGPFDLKGLEPGRSLVEVRTN